MPKILFKPAEVTVDCDDGSTVFASARAAGIMVDTACGGKGTCGLCRVNVLSGAQHLQPPEFAEKRFIGTAATLRLSCRVSPLGDIVVYVPPPRPPKAIRPKPPT